MTTRIKPPMGLDNAWWWQMADEGKLGIQRCLGCRTLRHPPRPMCGDCHSLDWDAVESSGKGSICSYTVLHHPQFPGYDYPLIIVLVDLAGGHPPDLATGRLPRRRTWTSACRLRC